MTYRTKFLLLLVSLYALNFDNVEQSPYVWSNNEIQNVMSVSFMSVEEIKPMPSNLPKIRGKNSEIRTHVEHHYPEVHAIIAAARKTAPELTDNTVVITSANDGRHKKNSLHYHDRAFDIRIWNIAGSHVQVSTKKWAVDLQDELGQDYDVILESDHLHVEWDPRSVAGLEKLKEYENES